MNDSERSGPARPDDGAGAREGVGAEAVSAGLVVAIDEYAAGRAELVERLWRGGRKAAGVESAAAYWDRFAGGEARCILAVHRRRGEGALGLLSECQRRDAAAPVIVLVEEAELAIAVQLMRAGAYWVHPLDVADAELAASLDEAMQFAAKRQAEAAARDALVAQWKSLTESEHEVLRLILEGLPNKSIAKQMELSLRTVENRRRSIYTKFGVENVATLVAKVCALPNWQELA